MIWQGIETKLMKMINYKYWIHDGEDQVEIL
jgi:hypothetical protein